MFTLVVFILFALSLKNNRFISYTTRFFISLFRKTKEIYVKISSKTSVFLRHYVKIFFRKDNKLSIYFTRLNSIVVKLLGTTSRKIITQKPYLITHTNKLKSQLSKTIVKSSSLHKKLISANSFSVKKISPKLKLMPLPHSMKNYKLKKLIFKSDGKLSIKKIAIVLLGSLVLANVVFIFGLIFLVNNGVFGKIPDNEALNNIQNREASLVFSVDGALIGKYYDENRSEVPLSKIPAHVIDALISTEDIRFLQHKGVDLRSLLRVFIKSLMLGNDNSGGGSTISQQLIKNYYGRKQYHFFSMPITKVREMIIASKLEEIYSKEEILALYLNTVSFGENVYGIENAAMRYFSKSCDKLTIEEGAILIGMLKANTYYNPHINQKNSFTRRNVVLSLMKNNNKISSTAYDSLKTIPLNLKYKSAVEYDQHFGYFLSYVKTKADSIINKYNADNRTDIDLLNDGLKIETTLDKRMQNIMLATQTKHLMKLQRELNEQLKQANFWNKNKNLISDHIKTKAPLSAEKKPTLLAWGIQDSVMLLSAIDSLKYYLSAIQNSILAASPQSGAIRTWIGGSNYQFYPFNRVLSKRQVGSTFKPIVYYTALEQGVKPCAFFKNEKKVYEEYDNWSPGNGTDEYEGYYSVRGALANSINTVAAQIIFEAGIENSIETAKRLGISSDIPEVPSIVLGVTDVSLFEMVQAYASFANGGYKTNLYAIESITTKQGTVIYKKEESSTQYILDKDITAQLTFMLTDVVNSGTARRIREVYNITDDVAGKTGTTQNNTDGWFIGFTPNLIMGVWTGLDNPAVHFQNTLTGQGANVALPIWAMGYNEIMKHPWGKLYSGTFSIELSRKLDCELWRLEDENMFEKLFKRRRNRDSPDTIRQNDKKKRNGWFKRWRR